MSVLGVSHTIHGSAACLAGESGITGAVVEERFNRRKYSADFPLAAMRYSLREGGMEIEDVEGFAYSMTASNFLAQVSKPQSEQLRFYPEAYYGFPNHVLPQVGAEWADCVEQSFRLPGGKKVRFYYVDHHLSHAAEAFYLSPYKEAAILTVDGRGDGVSAMFSVGREGKITPLKRVPFPHSIGQVYATFTEFLGFKPSQDEFKVMGLAGYGKAERLYDRVRALVKLFDDGMFEIDLPYFSYFVPGPAKFNRKFIDTFGQPRNPSGPITQNHMDLAAAIQAVFEETLLHMATALHRMTGLSTLCYGGGVALNSLGNGRLLTETPFKNLWISSSPNDSGACRGAAAYTYASILGRPFQGQCRHDYLGPAWENAEIEKFLGECGLKYETLTDPAQTAASEIAAGKIVGWFQGRMEFGPRALGNRSILADPRRAEMKKEINQRIKFREWFRPFAPSVIAEEAATYFEVTEALLHVGGPLDFMTYVCPVKESKRDLLPAVTHVDGTARLQIVHQETNPTYYRLLRAFEALSGIPVVLNTSFNLNNEPMVCSPADAVKSFYMCGLDSLFLNHFLLRK